MVWASAGSTFIFSHRPGCRTFLSGRWTRDSNALPNPWALPTIPLSEQRTTRCLRVDVPSKIPIEERTLSPACGPTDGRRVISDKPFRVPYDNPIYHLLIQILEFLIKKTWGAAATSLIAVALKV
jgi:hypothetical protein